METKHEEKKIKNKLHGKKKNKQTKQHRLGFVGLNRAKHK